MTSLLTLIIAIAALLGPRDRGPADEVRATFVGIATAVDADTEPPLTGSKEGDAALMTSWAHAESRWRICPEGDGGKALGAFQEQHTPRSLACAPAEAARIWLTMARQSIARCGDLTAVVSGVCGRGRRIVRRRAAVAERARREVER